MKYFTREWWSSGCGEAEALFRQYDKYVASISHALPPRLIEFKEAHTLHDSEVKRINCDFEQGEVELEFHGWNINLEFPVRYNLTYTGVSLFEQLFPQDEYVEQELGDLGYWECELLNGSIEMRMLFASDAEFRIIFRGFEFTHATVKA